MLLLACDIVSLCAQAVGGCIAAFTPVTDQAMILHPPYLPHSFHYYADDLILIDQDRDKRPRRRPLDPRRRPHHVLRLQPRVPLAREEAPGVASEVTDVYHEGV